MSNKYQILIVGGGTAGIMTAAQLKRANSSFKIGILEPSAKHYYQPAWTLVGANTYDYKKTVRQTKDYIPSGVDWIKESAQKVDPKNNKLTSDSGKDYEYEYLIVCPGIKVDPGMLEGLQEALDRRDYVCSNYTDPEFTWKVLSGFKGGNAVFSQPTTPIKCGGAPQKIAYLAADHIRRQGLKGQSQVILTIPGNVIFAVKEIARTLLQVIDRYDIHLRLRYAPVKVDGKNRTITFQTAVDVANQCVVNESTDNPIREKIIQSKSDNALVEIPYDMLHIAPPQRAPDFVSKSELASETGWLAVNIETLQHKKFPNVFGLGDSAELPTAKTGAAIRKQVPIVVANLLSVMNQKQLNGTYNGYSSCPLVTGYGKMVLAEFDYLAQFTPDPVLKKLFIFDSSKEHYRLWLIKKYVLPYLYWNKMLKGHQV